MDSKMSGEVLVNAGEGGVVRHVAPHGRLNAMSRTMWRQLRSVFEGIQASNARCVVMAGEGGAFCAGGYFRNTPVSGLTQPRCDFHENDVGAA